MEPKNLQECLDLLIKTPAPGKEDFQLADEDEATTAVHHHGGRGLRNDWNLWDPDSPLHKFFKEKYGLWHADDMSSIIFTCLHRKLNDKPLDIRGQCKVFYKHWLQYEPENEGMPQLKAFVEGEGDVELT